MTISGNGTTHVDTRNIEELSRLALIAADASYLGRFAEGGLRAFDDTPQYASGPFGSQPQPPFGSTFNFLASQYQVVRTFERIDDRSGFKAIALQEPITRDIVIAFAGTDGGDLVDWWGNAFHYGWNQWGRYVDEIRQYLLGAIQEPADRPIRVHFTGQSLGGALAQYAAYDFVSVIRQRPLGVSERDVSLVTFNALGGTAGLRENVDGFDSTRLNQIGINVHYVVQNDLVHRLGEGLVGGTVKRFDWIEPSATAPFNRLDPVEAHRIESAFYRFLSDEKGYFAEARPIGRDYVLNIPTFQTLLSRYGNLQQKAAPANKLEAAFQAMAGVIAAGKEAPPAEVNAFMRALTISYRDSGHITPLHAELLLDTDWPAVFKEIDATGPGDLFSTYRGAIAVSYIGTLYGALQEKVIEAAKKELANVDPVLLAPDDLELWAHRTAILGRVSTVGSPVGLSVEDREELAKRMSGGDDWLTQSSAFLLRTWAAKLSIEVAVETLVERALEGAVNAGVSASIKLKDDAVDLGRRVSAATLDLARAIGNSVGNYLVKVGSVSQIQAQAEYEGSKAIADAFLNALRKARTESVFPFDAMAQQELRGAEALVKQALSSVVIVPGAATNPFNSSDFNPDFGTPASSGIGERSAKLFTLFLPYDAGAGGQRILLSASGQNGEHLRLNVGAEIPNIGGTFTVIVPEGARQLSLAFSVVGDVDLESALEIRAQLIDEFGNATHVEDLELNLTIDGQVEAGGPNQPPQTTRLIEGDLQLLDGDPSTPEIDIVLDDIGNPVTTGIAEPRADNLKDSPGNDEIRPGEEADFVDAFRGGDDAIYGGAGNDELLAGPGNDWVEGESDNDYLYGDDGNDRLIGGDGTDFLSGDLSRDYILNRGALPDASTTYAGDDVLEGGASGMDMLIGGGGRDSLYADVRIETDAAIQEGETASPSGMRGDWLAGGAGDDYLVGSHDDEVLFGGSGGDLMIGGAGDDHLTGDQSFISEVFDWQVTETVATVGNETTYTYDYGVVFSDGDSGAAGDDRIYAGAGNDVIAAGGGDDFVDAGSGDDKAWGDGGSDVLFGGAGNDLLNGDNSVAFVPASEQGDDFIDGGDGDDEIYGGGGNDALYGGAGNDFLQGDTIGVVGGDDYLNGEDGDDVLIGNGGADVLIGGAGDDQLFGDSDDTPLAEQGADELIGGEGNDLLQGYGGDDYLDGGAGNDEAYGGAGADTVIGGDGDDRLFGEDGSGTGEGGNDTIFGGLGDDQIRGEGGDDTIDGGAGADIIGGDDGNDTIYGGLGNDQISGGEGDDILRGEAGDDIVFGDAGADDIDGGYGNDQIDAGAGSDRVAGGAGNDTILGGDDDDELLGDEGDDILLGGGGADFLDGGAGNDHLQGGSGVDTYVWDFGSGEDTVADDLTNLVRFGPGITRDFISLGIGSLLIQVGGENALHIEGFNPQMPYAPIGISELQFTDFDGNVVDTMTWNELIDLGFDLVGTPDPDVIVGTEAADRIFGLEGPDILQGLGGNDAIYGGPGADNISGGPGDDTLFGEDGDDSIHGGMGNDVAFGDAGNDVLNLAEGDDTADGGEGNDVMHGGDGADVLEGGDGNDALHGDAGDDTLSGGAGDDLLEGGTGSDVLVGGPGNDTYVLEDGLDIYVELADEGSDTIVASLDFTLGEHFENLELAAGSGALNGTGSAVANVLRGNENDNVLLGLEGDDSLLGNAGNDLLDGGAGDDTMAGGLGDDTYIVDSELDVVTEQIDVYQREVQLDEFGNVIGYGVLVESGGYDEVRSSVSFALDQFTEALTLTGADAIDGVGNVEANVIRGNDADNALYAYRLNGEADTYPSVGTVIQQFTEPRNAREELLQDKANAAVFRAEFSWFIPQQVDLVAGEGDTLIGGGGDDRLYGSLDDDTLAGGDGDDFLYGFAGADTMSGGAGDDTYVVSGAYALRFNYVGGEYVDYQDDSTDTLIEMADEGIDTVYSEVDFALPDNFENLTLLFDTRDFDPDAPVSIGRSGHIGAQVGEGNALDNIIVANDGGNELYGYEGDDTLIGGAGGDYLEGGDGADMMRGGAGDDEYAVDQAGDQVVEETGGGHDSVYAEIDYTLTENVEDLYLGGETFTENLRGTGNALDNWIEGNDGDNVLLGLDGNDVLYGWGGDDLMDGGAGDDTYYVDSELDVTIEAADGGHDTVYSEVSHTLGDGLEDLYLTGTDFISGEGNALDNVIVGNDVDNGLQGFAGNDVLRGEGGWDVLIGDEGNDLLDGGTDGDQMFGGSGDDTYYVDDENDVVVEESDEGIDTVYEDVSYYVIGENVENAVMLGDFQDIDDFNGWAIEGNALDNEITGNDNDNRLEGREGQDVIDGRARDDEIFGGFGDDRLYGGDDAISYEQLYIDSFGNIYSFDFGGLKPLSVLEGELASNSDRMFGEEGDDTLDGGSGDDELFGGQGNDMLYGGDDGLVADDAERSDEDEETGEGGGTDETEDGKVFLTNEDILFGGDGDDVLDGGSGDDELYGEDGNDTLYGGADGPLNTDNDDYLDGGAGIDFMAGGTGDDTYVVDGFFVETTDIEVFDDCGKLIPGAVTRLWTTDTVLENVGEGYDRVFSSADFTLPENVEELILEWFTDARIGRGNAGDNSISGNEVANRLEGGGGHDYLFGGLGDDVLDGGAGNDYLAGESGNDTYLFGYGYGHDTIDSYGGGLDRVHLEHGITPDDVTLVRRGSDVIIGLGGDDRMVLLGWFVQPTNRVQEIMFCDAPAWDEATIAALANANLNAVIAVNDFAQVFEDAPDPASGNVLDNDAPAGSTLTVVDPRVEVASFGILQLAADGSFTFAVDNTQPTVQWLAVGEHLFESFSYIAADGAGGYDEATLFIDIAGTNDAPVLDSGAQAELVEDLSALEYFAGPQRLENGGFESGLDGWTLDGNIQHVGWNSLSASGFSSAFFGAIGEPTLLTQDVETAAGERYLLGFTLWGGADAGAAFSVIWNGETVLTVNEADPDSGDYDYEVIVEGIDGISQLTLAGRNDPGFWHLDDVRLGLLDAIALDESEASGTILFTDPDYSDSHVLTVEPRDAGYLGEFDAYIDWDSAFNWEGQVAWEFFVPNEDLQFLAEGETREQVYDLVLEDDFGGSDTKSVTITLRGVNDAPEIEDDAAEVSEDGVLSASGNVLDNDFDIDALDVLSVANPGSLVGQYGTLDLAADGRFTYTLDNDSEAVQALNAGEQVEDVFEYGVTDGLAIELPQFFVTITGANDAPIAADDAADVQEDGVQVAAGNVLDNDTDVDAGSVLALTNPGVYAGAYGSLALGADGSFVYTLDNAAAQSLAEGEEIEEVFAYDVTDGLETSSAELTVTVHGTNDAPTAEDLAAIVSENGPPVVLAPVYEDIDAAVAPALAAGSFGNTGFELDSFAGWQLSDTALGDVLTGGAALGARYASLRSGAGQDAYTTLSRSFVLAAGESLSGFAEFLAGDALPFDDDGYVTVRLLGGAPTSLFGASVSTVGDYGATGWTPFEFVAPEAGTYVLEAGVRNATDNSVDSRLNLDGIEQFAPAPGVTLNPDGTFGYDPGGRYQWLAADESAFDLFEYTVTDEQGTAAIATATLEILGENDAPFLVQPIADQTAQAGTPFSLVLAPDTFDDVDLSDTLTYAAALADGNALPEWLAFDAGALAFSGTPPAELPSQVLEIRATASDPWGASASDTFLLEIAGAGEEECVPIVGTDGDDVIDGTAGDDIIDGRKGYDRMSGGAGDDAYYVDLTCTPHGNEGVGNGEDPPPPGHATNQNDGPGTSPGNPGSKGGHDHDEHEHGGKSGKQDECRVDLVLEDPNAGYDTVYSSANYALPDNVEELHLIGDRDLAGWGNAQANILVGNTGDNRLYGLAGNDLLLDDKGEDLLDGGEGDDVLDGGKGNDTLLGGKGNDLYVHARGGGHDEVRDSGGQDAVRFGAGIAAGDVHVRRSKSDLVLTLAGGRESVTLKDWFSSSSKRVERVEFADGTAWDETALRARVSPAASTPDADCGDDRYRGKDDLHGWQHGHDDDHGRRRRHGHDDDGDPMYDAIAARLRSGGEYDFTALAAYLQRGGDSGYGAMTPEEIANRWVKVQECVAALAPAGEDCADGHGGHRFHGGFGHDDGHGHRGWGHHGSTGHSAGWGGMSTFGGLHEGFHRL